MYVLYLAPALPITQLAGFLSIVQSRRTIYIFRARSCFTLAFIGTAVGF